MNDVSASADLESPRASIVIVNFNGLRYLDACIESLLAQELEGGLEVIVVDNASADGSVDHLRERWPSVRVVEAERNLGFAGGNNLGMRQARGRYLVLLNNDTRVRQGWVRALVSAVESDDTVGAVASKLLFMDRPDVIQNAGSLVLTDGSGADRGTGERDTGQYDEREEVFAACGCGVLYRREMLAEVGDLDETFFCYYEDTDLSWRMRLKGWRVLYEPTAVVEHAHSGTSVEWSPFFIFHVDRNRLFMLIKNAAPLFAARAFARLAALSLGLVLRGVLRRVGRGEGGGAVAPGLSRARIHMRVLGSLIKHLPEMIRKRSQTRRGSVVGDAEIRRWFYSRELWHEKLAN